MKLPYCTHPDAKQDNDYRTKAPFRPLPSLALASLYSFFEKYRTCEYKLQAVDLNIEAYSASSIPINIAQYQNSLAKYIRESIYDVLALSVTFIFNARWVQEAVELSRKFHPQAKIIVGGGYPTLLPERVLQKHDVDDVVVGEGEATFLHIINKYNNYTDKSLEEHFPFGGYAIRDSSGHIQMFPQRNYFLDMRDLPPPRWDCLNVEKYFANSGDMTLPIEASRGCPYNCSFCSTFISWGRKIRYKPVDNFVQEVYDVKQKYPNVNLSVVDDNMTFSKEWITQCLTQIISRNLTHTLTPGGFSVKHLDEEVIDLWIKAGCERFHIAVETGSPEMQKHIRKNIDLEKVRQLVSIFRKKNVSFNILWMVGFPGETLKQIQETFALVRELRAFLNQFSIVLPYPQTELFNQAKEQDLLAFDEENLENYDRRKADCVKSNEWDHKQLLEMIYDINIETNFLNNPFLETAEKMDYFLAYLENLLIKLPDHVIAHIVVGYIQKKKNNNDKRNFHYNRGLSLLRDDTLSCTFKKYLKWDHEIIKDFNSFHQSNES